MLQLASSSVVLLIRTCRIGLPQELIDFCRDEEIVGVGFAWDNSDERKLQDSFGLGRRDLFTHFVDVRIQAELMGYHGSVSSLAKLLLGFPGTGQSNALTMSNWEASYLNPRQINYAALDALITGDLFRALRSLHANPRPCTGCQLPVGEYQAITALACAHPTCDRKSFNVVAGLLGHMKQKGHVTTIFQCPSCQRVQTNPNYQAALSSAGHPQGSTRPPGDPQMQRGNRGRNQHKKRDHQIYTAYNAYS